MNQSKKAILNRVREGLNDRRGESPAGSEDLENDYIQSGNLTGNELTGLFAERVGEYRADVNIVDRSDLKDAIERVCSDHNVKMLVLPPGLPGDWVPGNVEIMTDDNHLTHNELDSGDAVLTGCSLAIAQTGSIVLDGGQSQGRRALTLLPDFHICVVAADQIVQVVPEAFARIRQKYEKKLPPITFISGPSATSDIELKRVEGVHGPRRLHVFIVNSVTG